MDAELPALSKTQREQVLHQWKEQQHGRIEIDLPLSGHGEVLPKFVVWPGVLNPALVTARYLATYLYYNNERLFTGKRVLDMGTGSGVQGIVMALCGATEVVLTDISEGAVKNAQENTERFSVWNRCAVVQGDLFENVQGVFDLIVFNHPFFGDDPPEDDSIAASMLNPGTLISRFMDEVLRFLEYSGTIIMPFYSGAGKTNDPSVQAPLHGLKAKRMFRMVAQTGLQLGEIFIYELKQHRGRTHTRRR
jgi:methylase of polypeptide subunit release factors